jgi:hypothetical protein
VDSGASLPKYRAGMESFANPSAIELTQALRDWHDFYVLGGTAAATLIGLMFVAATIGVSYFDEKNEAGLRLFLTPTVVHLGAVLATCLLITVPTQTWTSLGALLMAGSAIGIIYSGRVAIDMRRQRFYQSVDVFDRLWYALLPMAAYLLVTVVGFGLLAQQQGALNLLAVGLGLLLLLGIRNAWDMTVWVVIRIPNK